jgi:pyruvate dehydrogenase E2 component (dihydrolipoamide acetyltransferase)
VYEFRLADVGEGIHEVEVLAWNVQPGDQVGAFQPLCQVESAKATVELTSPVAGRVVETRIPEGGMAQVGQVLAVIEEEAKEYFGIVGAPPSAPPPASAPPGLGARPKIPAEVASPPAGEGPASDAEPGREGPVRAAPLVRRVAKEQGIRLEDVAGSGPQGRVRLADLERHKPQSQPVAADTTRVELRGVRRRMAERMSEAARHVPAVTAMDTFDVSGLVALRGQLQAAAEQQGQHLTYLPFIVKATLEALKAVPEANATYDEAGPAIVISKRYHVGVAVAAPHGLLVPVIRDADQRSLLDLASELARLTSAARSGRLEPRDLSGSTFTISSFGGLGTGVQFATPIVNYPEVAILGIGRIEQQARVINGQITPRDCLGVSFTFDHRVLDGEAASRFLSTLRVYLERPAELLLRLR